MQYIGEKFLIMRYGPDNNCRNQWGICFPFYLFLSTSNHLLGAGALLQFKQVEAGFS